MRSRIETRRFETEPRFLLMLRNWRTRQAFPANAKSDFGLWWPILLIGPSIVLLRFASPAPIASVATWIVVSGVLVIQVGRSALPAPALRKAVPLAGFVVLSAASLLWSPDPQQGIEFVGSMTLGLLGFVWGTVNGPPTGSTTVWVAGVLGLTMAALALVVSPNSELVSGLNPDRILAMGVLVCLVVAWYGPRTWWTTLVIGLGGIVTVLASGSRTATVLVLVLVLAAPGLRIPSLGRVLVGGLLLVLIVVVVSVIPDLQERWLPASEGSGIDITALTSLETSGRGSVWPSVASGCGFTLVGNGAGTANAQSSRVSDDFPEPHNEYLRVWCDSGLIGSLLFWGFIVSCVGESFRARRRARRSWASDAGLQVGLSMMLLAVTDNPTTTTFPFWLPALLILGWSTAESSSDDPQGWGQNSTSF